MSQSAIKASRRQIRRAFGSQAAETVVSLDQARTSHQQFIAQLAGDVQKVQTQLRELTEIVTHNATSLEGLGGDVMLLERARDRGLIGRLWWLLTGR